jgi:hypothetical protein
MKCVYVCATRIYISIIISIHLYKKFVIYHILCIYVGVAIATGKGLEGPSSIPDRLTLGPGGYRGRYPQE